MIEMRGTERTRLRAVRRRIISEKHEKKGEY